MLNYLVDPALIERLVPAGTEIGYDTGETLISIVGFLFLDTRLLGVPIPPASPFRRSEPALLCEKKISWHLTAWCSFYP